MKPIAQNRKARHDYEILDTVEVGVALHGGEVKSIKAGEVSIKEAFVHLRGGEAYLVNAYIKPYAPSGPAAGGKNIEPTRTRKLLLHRKELATLIGKSEEKQLTIIPLNIHLKRGYVKLDIALARGKKVYDKRQALKKREQEREAARAISNRRS